MRRCNGRCREDIVCPCVCVCVWLNKRKEILEEKSHWRKKYINSIGNVRVRESVWGEESRGKQCFFAAHVPSKNFVVFFICFQYLFGRVRCHEMISFNPFRLLPWLHSLSFWSTATATEADTTRTWADRCSSSSRNEKKWSYLFQQCFFSSRQWLFW